LVSPFAKAVALSHVYKMLLNGDLKPAGDRLFEQAALGLLARSGSLLAKPLPYAKPAAEQELYETIKFERASALLQVAVTQASFVSAARKLKTEAKIGDDAAPLLVRGVSNQPAVDAADARDLFYQITQSPRHDIDCKALTELYTDENGAKRKIKLVFVVHLASNLEKAQKLAGSDDEKREARRWSTCSSSWPRRLSRTGSSKWRGRRTRARKAAGTPVEAASKEKGEHSWAQGRQERAAGYVNTARTAE
jgi:hypothetical protein